MEWIRVKDRLPEKNERVGFTYDGKDIRDYVYYNRCESSWEYQNSLDYIITVETITHWMQLPEPPEEPWD